ncbi:MAG: type II secretion system protein GspG [Myxococcales bacterium]|nr:type II secretion system protein GspG [Myxococcales bacterium]
MTARRFPALLVKESQQILRDPSAILIAFVLPVVLLFALGATILWKARYDAQVRETRGAIGVAHRAVLAFRDREGRCPRSIEELLHPPSTGSHFLHAVPLDGWGHPLWIRCHGDGRADEIEVISAGPNGAWGDDDNIR